MSNKKKIVLIGSFIAMIIWGCFWGSRFFDFVYQVEAAGSTYVVTGTENYLGLRTAPEYDNDNIIGKLYNGDTVQVQNASGTYWYVYSPTLGKSGYVNSKYLKASSGGTDSSGGSGYSSSGGSTYVVTGTENYLGLRTAPEYNNDNIIGKLYNGDTVQVQNASGTYWYVYSPSLGKSGYVNSKYLKASSGGTGSSGGSGSSSSGGSTYIVTGTENYLGLRTAPEYNNDNIISKLYNGDTVQVQNASGTYWYVYSPTLGKSGYVNSKYLKASSGGTGSSGGSGSSSSGRGYTVTGTKTFLALRTEPVYDNDNIIGKLYNGEYVEAKDTTGTYWYVYAPTLRKSGYVDSKYLTPSGGVYTPEYDPRVAGSTYQVSGTTNYLALRTAAAFDRNNEIGKLYNGETVVVQNASGTYWYVYAPSLGKSGYVNGDYLIPYSGTTRVVVQTPTPAPVIIVTQDNQDKTESSLSFTVDIKNESSGSVMDNIATLKVTRDNGSVSTRTFGPGVFISAETADFTKDGKNEIVVGIKHLDSEDGEIDLCVFAVKENGMAEILHLTNEELAEDNWIGLSMMQDIEINENGIVIKGKDMQGEKAEQLIYYENGSWESNAE